MKISDEGLRRLKQMSNVLGRACYDEKFRDRLKKNPELLQSKE